jgi:ABC-2 type transport system permease protein
VNPVLALELRRRFRGRRTALVLGVYLLVLTGLMAGMHEVGRRFLQSQAGFGGPVTISQPTLGRFVVEGVLALLLTMVLLAGPAYAAGQIAGERERRTLPLVQATLLGPAAIAWGKLAAATAWVGLLVVAALPLVAIGAVFGGVEPLDVVLGLLAVVVAGLSVAAIALGVSALVRRTVAAVVISYAIVLVLVIGTGIATIALVVVREQASGSIWPLFANPFTTLAGAVNASISGGFVLPTPLSPFGAALRADEIGAVGLDAAVARTWSWLWSVAVLAGLGLVGFAAAVRGVRRSG